MLHRKFRRDKAENINEINAKNFPNLQKDLATRLIWSKYFKQAKSTKILMKNHDQIVKK
jgi:hypothetical protein